MENGPNLTLFITRKQLYEQKVHGNAATTSTFEFAILLLQTVRD